MRVTDAKGYGKVRGGKIRTGRKKLTPKATPSDEILMVADSDLEPDEPIKWTPPKRRLRGKF